MSVRQSKARPRAEEVIVSSRGDVVKVFDLTGERIDLFPVELR